MGTTKAGIFFKTDTLRNLATEHKDLTDAYSRKQSGLVKHIVETAGKHDYHLSNKLLTRPSRLVH
jgi:DNA mismatch repair protein MSH2